MIPFWFSGSGGLHVTFIDVEEVASTWVFLGGPLGAMNTGKNTWKKLKCCAVIRAATHHLQGVGMKLVDYMDLLLL